MLPKPVVAEKVFGNAHERSVFPVVQMNSKPVADVAMVKTK